MASFWARLFGLAGSKAEAEAPRLVKGALFDIVGESKHQDALSRITGGKRPNRHDSQCKALLKPQIDNPNDPNAVQVFIEGRVVGVLKREHAAEYRQALGTASASCDGKITGGWKDEFSEGDFGVKLKIKWPPRFFKSK